nr:hypothetical protein [uncultured Butyrivibrio sp.]
MEKSVKEISFNISIIIGAVELLKHTFEVKEEARNSFVNTDYYMEEIREQMSEAGILEEYLDLFDCADSHVIFDEYVSVDANTVEFDYTEAAEGSDRGNCYFRVSCTFDLKKYIEKMVAMNVKDSAERPSSYINGWDQTDDACFQYAKKLFEDCGLETWAYIQLEGNKEVGFRVRACTDLCLADYSKEYIEEVVSSYYDGGTKQIERDYPDSSQQIILECIFEQEQGDNCHFIREVKDEKEGYETVKRWLSDSGVLETAVRTLRHNHDRALGKKETENDVQNTSEAKLDDTIEISVYRESISPDLAGDDGVGTLVVDRELFLMYFNERILPHFRGDDKNASDEGLLQEWLDEYTPDDTTDLYDFIESHKDKNYYMRMYDKTYDKLLEQAKADNLPDPEAWANDTFNDGATAEEVVGYYLVWHGDDAFKDWMENLTFYTENQKDIPLSKKAHDEEVTRILSKLFNQMWITDIVWNIPEGKRPSGKLSENKVVPLPSEDELKTMGHDELEERICKYLSETYCFYPKEFSYVSPMDNLPMKYEAATTDILVIRTVEWYVPDGLKAPEADGPNETYCVELPSMEKFNTDDSYTNRILVELIQKYGFCPQYFQYIRPDGRAANYRHWTLSSSTMPQNIIDETAVNILAYNYLEQFGEHDAYEHWMTDKAVNGKAHMFTNEVGGILMKHYYDATTHNKNEGVGCYGLGTEACLNFCTGCDKEPPKYRNFYTLRCKDEIFKIFGKVAEFDTFEQAYDMMVQLWNEQKFYFEDRNYNPLVADYAKQVRENPKRYGIWETSVHGNNSMTRPCWS